MDLPRAFHPSFASLPCVRWPALAAVAGLFAGCAVGPNYRRPAIAAPPAFREEPGWKAATPRDAALRGDWWTVYEDPVLNGLEAQVAAANASLQVAEANYEQARQLARAEGATLWPGLSLDGSADRVQGTSHGGLSSSTAAGASSIVTTSSSPVNAVSVAGAVSWTVDIWGQTRRELESDIAAAQSDAALVAATRLSLQSTLAQDYIQIRALDERKRLLDNAVIAYRRTLEISQNKYRVGVVSRSDVVSAQAQVDATRAQAVDVGVQRASLEHAVAVLVGKAPTDLTISGRSELGLASPAIPGALPSELLERRPDVAQAERNAAAANARIGVQEAAYFPTLTLSASGGFQGSRLAHLFELPNRVWSLGASAGEALFSAGSTGDEVRAARAAWDSAAAQYRGTVLSAFQQVEDELAALRILGQEVGIDQAAVGEAADASRIARNEYQAGTVDYTTVVTAEEAELADREALLQVRESRLVASVVLIQALGGGWAAADLPGPRQVLAHRSQSPSTVAAPR
ncbi:MAG: efflux transporter outer membrane subunit [Stellaceae bacterium]